MQKGNGDWMEDTSSAKKEDDGTMLKFLNVIGRFLFLHNSIIN